MSIERFLRQRAVDITMEGTYVLSELVRPAGQAAHIRLPHHPRFPVSNDGRGAGRRQGRRLPDVLLPDFGNFEGTISDTRTGGFLLELDMTQIMRAKLADKLTWLEKKHRDPCSIADARKHPRFVPRTPHSTLTLADGTVHGCVIQDVSLSGAAVSAQIQPPIGTPLAVGACIGRVVRHFQDGFAVKFVQEQSRDDLNRLIARVTPV